ncbi:hypothetical protein PV10_00876 [Exophiala mesophila]|uniref:Uncharacterized protein n=1 Tax=Exophiala mesophila TaxID=212818 RepID=A0A0D1Y8V5_EXOME|nr:uncharacterized protein PV10_00876 [Exophiala mesophila]KIV97081.1 hypothetical protein PV10_00876 [Exophiala mesophila]
MCIEEHEEKIKSEYHFSALVHQSEEIQISIFYVTGGPSFELSIQSASGDVEEHRVFYKNFTGHCLSFGAETVIIVENTARRVEVHFRHCNSFEAGAGDFWPRAIKTMAAFGVLSLTPDIDAERQLRQERIETLVFLTWVVKASLPLCMLNDIGVYCTFPEDEFGDAKARYEQNGSVPSEWYSAGGSPGLRCTLFRPSFGMSASTGLSQTARLYFPETETAHKIFNPFEPAQIMDHQRWSESEAAKCNNSNVLSPIETCYRFQKRYLEQQEYGAFILNYRHGGVLVLEHAQPTLNFVAPDDMGPLLGHLAGTELRC